MKVGGLKSTNFPFSIFEQFLAWMELNLYDYILWFPANSYLGVRINLLYCVRSIVWETFAINLGEKMAENLAENLISAYNVQL